MSNLLLHQPRWDMVGLGHVSPPKCTPVVICYSGIFHAISFKYWLLWLLYFVELLMISMIA